MTAPQAFNPVVDIVEHWAASDPDAIALISIASDGQTVKQQTVRNLTLQSQQMARALLDLSVVKGDRVLIMMSRVPAWYTAMLGALRIGAVAVPTPNQCTARDVAYRLQMAEPAVVIADEAAAQRAGQALDDARSVRHRIVWSQSGRQVHGWQSLDDLLERQSGQVLPPQPTAADEPLFIFFTSGTVSHPRMVLHRQLYPLGHVATARHWHGLGPGDRHWTVADTGWAKAAWGSLFGQWHERAAVVQVDLARADAHAILAIIRDHRVTSFCAPPTLYRSLVQEDLRTADLSCLRQCTSAGEPLNPEVIRAWREGTGLTIRDGYGQTETTLLVANMVGQSVRPGSMGKPVPGYEVAIVDDDGRRLTSDQLGNIAVATSPRPPGLFSEYLNNDAETKNAFRAGWYFTGDRAHVDDDGYFWFSSRADDVITSSAYRIGPFEVESALIEHPAVREAAVVGRDDAQRTQIVCAFVILARGYEPSEALTGELQEHVRRVTAPYKYPREIHYCDELPKTISGKIRRSELRRRLGS
jgi:acetyl-CoA synthetase